MAGNWTNEEKTHIAKTFGVLVAIQKSYGNDIDIKSTLRAWQVVLGDYPAGQLISAMQEWVKRHRDMPTPSDMIKLMNPEPTRITQTEFIHAKEQWKLEGFPNYSYYAGIVKEYEKQEGEARTPEPVAEVPLGQLISEIKGKLEAKK